MLMVRGERPTMRGLIPVNGGEERTAAPAETYLRQNAPSSSLPPMLALPKTFHNDQWTSIDLDPKCPAFLPSVRQNKKRSKVGKIKWVLEEGGGRRGNNSFRSFPPSWRGESEGGQRLGWGTSGVAWLRSGTPARQQRGIQQPEEAPARQFTELSRPCCKFLVRRP